MTDLTPNHPAVAAVLKLHKPVQARMTSNDGVRDVTVCDHCLDPTWPCQTVAAIITARAGIPTDTLVDPLDDHHPAVQAADAALRAWMADLSDALPDDMMVYVLAAVLPHLTADDLRDTPAGRALMAEGWDQGAEAGERDYATALDPGHECIPNPYRKGNA